MGFSKGLQQLRSCAARQPRASGAVPPWVPPLPPPPVSIWRGDGPAASISRGDGPGRLDGRPFRAMARPPQYRQAMGQAASISTGDGLGRLDIDRRWARPPRYRQAMGQAVSMGDLSGRWPGRLDIQSLVRKQTAATSRVRTLAAKRHEFRIFHHAPGASHTSHTSASRVRTSTVAPAAKDTKDTSSVSFITHQALLGSVHQQ